jgi:hypothetical protein
MSVAVKLRPVARLNPPSVILSGARNPRVQADPEFGFFASLRMTNEGT